MNTQSNTQPVAEPTKTAPIVAADKLAPVQPSGIVNKNNIATAEQISTFCKLIVAGLPTGKIFPTKLSEMEFTDAQKLEIANARTTHRRLARQNKSKLVAFVKQKNVLLTGHKTNSTAEKGRISYVKDSIFKKKTPAQTQAAKDKFFGETVPSVPAK